MQLGLQVAEEVVYAFKVLVAAPEQLLLGFCKLVIRTMDGKIELDAVLQQRLEPFAHRFAAPGSNSAFVYRERFVGNNKILVYAQHFTESLTRLAGAEGVIEAEEVYGGLCKRHSVQLETIGEVEFLFLPRIPCNLLRLQKTQFARNRIAGTWCLRLRD